MPIRSKPLIASALLAGCVCSAQAACPPAGRDANALQGLLGVTDRRGFDATQGWRHGVAHGADLLLQLGLNPALSAAQLDAIVQAIASQVAPAGEHFYVYGEPERLARPIAYIAKRTTGP